jgi:hypothetical protein
MAATSPPKSNVTTPTTITTSPTPTRVAVTTQAVNPVTTSATSSTSPAKTSSPVAVASSTAASTTSPSTASSTNSRRETKTSTSVAPAPPVVAAPRVIINPEVEATSLWSSASDDQRNETRRQWEHAIYSELLLVTLTSPDAGRVYLRQLAEETNQITRLQLDMLLIERLSMPFELPSTAIGYLISCYRVSYHLVTNIIGDCILMLNGMK